MRVGDRYFAHGVTNSLEVYLESKLRHASSAGSVHSRAAAATAMYTAFVIRFQIASRPRNFLCILAYIALVLVLSNNPRSAAEIVIPEIEKIPYSGVFDIPTLGYYIADFYAAEDGLYFLLRQGSKIPRQGGPAAILLTDTRGQNQTWIPILNDGSPVPRQARASAGQIAVLTRGSISFFQ
ncbi:MAG: hypothetical protein M3Y07_09490 [Acidobacteriota bacterium]|nr:hypothetical protein [Acidobacteriota bacterium]